MVATDHVGIRLRDCPEFVIKKSPLARTRDATVSQTGPR